MEFRIDDNERKLISALRTDSRTSLLALSKQLKMPPSTVHSKMNQYIRKKITKNTTLIDFNKLGYQRAMIMIRTTPDSRNAVESILIGHSGINNLHKINSGDDYLFEMISNGQKEIEDFVAEIRTNNRLIQIAKFPITEDLTRERFLQQTQ